MVNSGAIIVTSLIQNKLDMADRFEHVGFKRVKFQSNFSLFVKYFSMR